MSSEKIVNDNDYDQDLLAEKYITMKGLSDDNSTSKHLQIATFDADNMIRLIKRGLHQINYKGPIECALDVGCGEGHISRVLIQEKFTHNVVGIDKSKDMIKHAQTHINNDGTHYQYIVANVITDDLLTILGQSVPLIVQTYMLCHTENVNQLSQILSNIAKVCCGIFVGIIPNPRCNYSSDAMKKLLKYGIKFTGDERETTLKDGGTYQVTFEIGTPNEITLVDHWYSSETYERIFKQVGFKSLDWIPVQLDRNKDDAFLIDLVGCDSVIGFLASMI